jgi:hypothetical protein
MTRKAITGSVPLHLCACRVAERSQLHLGLLELGLQLRNHLDVLLLLPPADQCRTSDCTSPPCRPVRRALVCPVLAKSGCAAGSISMRGRPRHLRRELAGLQALERVLELHPQRTEVNLAGRRFGRLPWAARRRGVQGALNGVLARATRRRAALWTAQHGRRRADPPGQAVPGVVWHSLVSVGPLPDFGIRTLNCNLDNLGR